MEVEVVDRTQFLEIYNIVKPEKGNIEAVKQSLDVWRGRKFEAYLKMCENHDVTPKYHLLSSRTQRSRSCWRPLVPRLPWFRMRGTKRRSWQRAM